MRVGCVASSCGYAAADAHGVDVQHTGLLMLLPRMGQAYQQCFERTMVDSCWFMQFYDIVIAFMSMMLSLLSCL